MDNSGNVSNVQGGGTPVEQAYTEKDEEGRYSPQYLVLEGCLELLLVDAEGNEIEIVRPEARAPEDEGAVDTEGGSGAGPSADEE